MTLQSLRSKIARLEAEKAEAHSDREWLELWPILDYETRMFGYQDKERALEEKIDAAKKELKQLLRKAQK